MPYLTDRVRLSPVSVVDACTRTVQESRLFRRTYTQASTRLLHLNCTSPIRIRRTNQALAPTFWSPFIRNDIGIALHAERAKPVPVALSMNVKDKTVAATRLTATMHHHSHPVIGADPGDSALLYVASWSSPKVLMAQTADPLSAVQEHVHPSFRPSLGEMQARLINKTADGSASALIRPYSHA